MLSEIKFYHPFKMLNTILCSWIALLNAGKIVQTSITNHFVSYSEEKVEIKENYFGFLEIFDSTGQGLHIHT